MSRGFQLIGVGVCLLLLTASRPVAGEPEPGVVEVAVAGPMAIGFYPPVSDAEIEEDPGTREGLAHLEFALSDVAKCLKSQGVSVRAELARILVLRVGDTVHRIDLPHESVGAYLVVPGREPRVVYATAGPSSLQVLLPNAAAEYFHAPNCKVDL